jgi:hypothetical protein
MPKLIFTFPNGKPRKELHKDMQKEKYPLSTDYSTISRRINRLDIKINENKSGKFEDDYIVVAIYSTGIKVTDRGHWMRDKWHVKRKDI